MKRNERTHIDVHGPAAAGKELLSADVLADSDVDEHIVVQKRDGT